MSFSSESSVVLFCNFISDKELIQNSFNQKQRQTLAHSQDNIRFLLSLSTAKSILDLKVGQLMHLQEE